MGTHTSINKMKFLVVCGLMAYCLLSCTAELNQENGIIEAKQTNQAKLFGGYTTRTRLSTLTSTILKSCLSALANAAVCAGKRRKRASVLADMQPLEVKNTELSSSNAIEFDDHPHNIEARSADDSKGKLFIALTSFTTITTTEYSVNAATTVSISYSCIPLGDTTPPLC